MVELSAAERADVIDAYRLVYRADSMVNWCPGLGTVLANEEVTADGRSDRGNFPVFRKRLRQWMMRITAYSDRLLDDLDVLDWPDKVKTMQRNWIGRSRGAQVRVRAGGGATSRSSPPGPDTLFGATYMVLAPEHDLVDELIAAGLARRDVDARWTYGAATPGEAVAAYRRAIAAKSDLERQENKDQDRRLPRALRDQSGQRATGFRSSSPTTCWRATAPARSWRCPATTSATGSSPPRSACRSWK